MTIPSSNPTNGFGTTHNITEKENENRKLIKRPWNRCSGQRYSGYASYPPFPYSLSNFLHLTADQERCGRINKAEDDICKACRHKRCMECAVVVEDVPFMS
jgi:hypothetical protein